MTLPAVVLHLIVEGLPWQVPPHVGVECQAFIMFPEAYAAGDQQIVQVIARGHDSRYAFNERGV